MTDGFVWTDRAVREALGIDAAAAAPNLRYGSVSTDTRTVKSGDLFVALRGERFDGHEFVAEAASKGAGAAVVSRTVDPDELLPLYPVSDTLEALANLARYRRRALPGSVIGVTGSSGKTTVKELLSAALGGSFTVYATEGNLNNQVGVPLTLLAAPLDAQFLVIEMGTDSPGEIGILTAVAEPNHSVVTTVSEAHLSGLGSLEGVVNEKLDLVRGTRPGGAVVVGDEPPLLPVEARKVRRDVHVTGLTSAADPDLRPSSLSQESDGTYSFRLRDRDIRAGIPGLHGVRNLLLALGLARLLGVDESVAIENASAVRAGPLRGEIARVGGLTMILDCYNANPQSTTAALHLLASLPSASSRVAVLGSMLELGDRSSDLHRVVLNEARSLPLDLVIAIGEFASAARDERDERKSSDGQQTKVIAAETVEDGYEALAPHLEGTETILLKGSRGVALETLIGRFERDFGSGREV